jgi:poly-gamma-glutamate system protein
MKKVYWRPRRVSRTALVLIALISLTGLFLVESFRVTQKRPYFAEKMAASELAAQAMERVYLARTQLGPEINPITDPAQSGMIGLSMSPATSISGDLTAKQTTANPNFAAVVIDMLKRAGVKEGDAVAVGCSGSFPALNICAYAALETLKTKPIVITSAASSQWGANVPNLLWIDMERMLQEEGIFQTRCVAASFGGYEDRGLGLTEEGRKLVKEVIDRNALPFIQPADFTRSVDQRMQIYQKHAGRSPIKAYINIGGGTVSVGRSVGKRLFRPGLNQRPPSRLQRVDGVMPRFIRQGIPVIHLEQITDVAERYGLPIAPTTMPEVGEASVFVGSDYNRWLTAAILVLILASLYGFIRSDIGFRLLRVTTRRRDRDYLEPMI